MEIIMFGTTGMWHWVLIMKPSVFNKLLDAHITIVSRRMKGYIHINSCLDICVNYYVGVSKRVKNYRCLPNTTIYTFRVFKPQLLFCCDALTHEFFSIIITLFTFRSYLYLVLIYWHLVYMSIDIEMAVGHYCASNKCFSY